VVFPRPPRAPSMMSDLRAMTGRPSASTTSGSAAGRGLSRKSPRGSANGVTDSRSKSVAGEGRLRTSLRTSSIGEVRKSVTSSSPWKPPTDSTDFDAQVRWTNSPRPRPAARWSDASLPSAGSTMQTLLATPSSCSATYLACARPGSSRSLTMTTFAPRSASQYSSLHFPAPPGFVVATAPTSARSSLSRSQSFSPSAIQTAAGGGGRDDVGQAVQHPPRAVQVPDPATVPVGPALAEVLRVEPDDVVQVLAVRVGVPVAGDHPPPTVAVRVGRRQVEELTPERCANRFGRAPRVAVKDDATLVSVLHGQARRPVVVRRAASHVPVAVAPHPIEVLDELGGGHAAHRPARKTNARRAAMSASVSSSRAVSRRRTRCAAWNGDAGGSGSGSSSPLGPARVARLRVWRRSRGRTRVRTRRTTAAVATARLT
jgi:hypothetical protein